jgi:tetratricopeptide (TPR) repeat protein
MRGAITDFSEAIRLDPGNASYFAQRAKAHGEAGEDETARTDFDRAIALAPNDPKLLTARAWIRRGEKDEAGARADAEAAAKLTPPASLEMNTIAGLMIELGDAARAASLLNATIAAHKDDARYATLLNTRCWARGLAAVELDAALVDCNLAIRLAGKAGGILDSRALVRFRQRNYAAALADYDVVLKGHEDEARFAWSRYMRGQTRTALGRADAGKIDHDAAIKADATVLDRARRYGL